MAEAEESTPFERAELVSVITNACDGADVAVMISAIPAASSERSPKRASLPPVASGPAARRGRILIVDDEISVARTLKALFQNEHDITLAASGNQALAAIAAEPGSGFDVILCDLMMPGMSGMDLFEHITRAQPGLEQRIVFMTGGVSMDRAREFLATSSNLTLEKPFDFAQLRQTLRRLVESAQSRR
ncbi:MAG: response regulator [Polyangiaceae bacterium]